MKKLIIMALLFALPLFGQHNTLDTPVVSTATIASLVTVSGSDTISSAAKAFGSVVVGQAVFGSGIPIGATVTALVNADLDSQVVVSSAATASATVSLNFGYFASTAYTSGDWIGLPFEVYSGSVGVGRRLVSATITDAADQLGSVDIVFFNAGNPGDGLDNAAAAVLAANVSTIVGIVSLTTATDLGAVKMLTKDDIGLQLPSGTIYGRLIARSTPTLTAIDNLRVQLRFQ